MLEIFIINISYYIFEIQNFRFFKNPAKPNYFYKYKKTILRYSLKIAAILNYFACLIERPILFLATSTEITFTLTISLTVKTSLGCLMNLLEISEI